MATNSRHRKNHKQKVEARKRRLADEKKKTEKFQRDFIMNMIKQEQEKGLFNNTQNVDQISTDGSILDGPVVDGPVIEGPSI
jgi:NAD-dependent SIR2 family protein deacetylase